MKGRQRHAAVDTLGLLLVAAVHGAGVSDSRGVRLVLIRLAALLIPFKAIVVDGGYKQGCLDWARGMFGFVLTVVKRTEAGFKVLPKRWIVERFFAWLSCARRHAKDSHPNPNFSQAAIYASAVRNEPWQAGVKVKSLQALILQPQLGV